MGNRVLRQITLFFILHFGVTSSFASTVHVEFSKAVTPEFQREIGIVIDQLKVLQFQDTKMELQYLLHIPRVDNINLENWLAERMHIIIDENHPMVAGANVKLKAAGNAGTVMTNIGTSLYFVAKKYSKPILFTIEGLGDVEIRTTKVGIFQVGPSFQNDPAEGINTFVHRVRRLATLFHESRHTDGNGDSLGFTHTLCPAGHVMENLYACDTPSNGPYRLGALIISAVEKGCTSCSAGDHDVLKILRNDNLSRVLPSPTPILWNDFPEALK